MLYPDHYVLTNDEHCTMTPEAHFCFVTTENGEQQNLYNLTTIPCVQRSLCLDEVIEDSSSAQVEFPKQVDSQTRDMLEAKHLEWKSWIDNEVFDLVDLRKVKPEELCGPTMGTHQQDRHARQLPLGKGQMGTARFPRQAEGLPTDRFPCFHKSRISDELPDGRQQKLGSFSH